MLDQTRTRETRETGETTPQSGESDAEQTTSSSPRTTTRRVLDVLATGRDTPPDPDTTLASATAAVDRLDRAAQFRRRGGLDRLRQIAGASAGSPPLDEVSATTLLRDDSRPPPVRAAAALVVFERLRRAVGDTTAPNDSGGRRAKGPQT
ncbi:hypothetical protein RYH80_00665 [Halobaculum sp. MBLA0147]|uniref:hypothetical protein n=1 Tax=Halobaculum sp. MBLA0147 TaxID=3079934 RepID=UPI003524B30C